MKCAFCDEEEFLPFTCRYCGQSFCAKHRLPESHNCLAIGARVISMRKTSDGEFEAAYLRWLPSRTSRTEILHLMAGVFIFFIYRIRDWSITFLLLNDLLSPEKKLVITFSQGFPG